ncbi:hypothetical protein D3C71_1428360 [compost metagenome]
MTDGIVGVERDQPQGIRDGGGPVRRVVNVASHLTQAILDCDDATISRIGEREAAAIALGHRSNTLARSVVGVRRDIRLSIRDAVVLRAAVDSDAGQPVGTVVCVAHAGENCTSGGNRADLSEVRAAVVEEGGLAIGIDHALHGVVRVVGEADRVATGVNHRQQTAFHRGLIALNKSGGAVSPHVASIGRVVGDRVESAHPLIADIRVLGSIPSVGGAGAIAISANKSAAGRGNGTGQLDPLAICTDTPVVPVVVIEQALAVVGPHDADVRPTGDQFVVEVLQDQIAVGNVDERLLPVSSLPCRSQHTALTQRAQ